MEILHGNTLRGNAIVGQSGGPTAAINATLAGVIRGALDEIAKGDGATITHLYGMRNGVDGLLREDIVELDALFAPDADGQYTALDRLTLTPAAALGSCRRKLTDADYPTVIETLKKFNIGCFFYNGGNDSMDTCNKVSKLAQAEGLDVKVIGIPKTMDNDLDITDNCPGFGSAARYAAESACELALDASGLPIHVVVLELMGRNAGWVTAASALAARATNCEVLTYLPEMLVDEDKMLADIEGAWAKGKGLLVTVSEGICGLDGKPLASTGIVDGFGHMIPGGTAQHVTDNIIQKLQLKSRAEKPGLLGRAAIPYASRVDQLEAYAVGKYAVEAALKGESDYMVAIEGHRGENFTFDLFLAPLAQVANVEKKFPLEWIIDGNKIDDRFFDYAMPLMMDKAPDYAILR